jgi:FAD binding domain
VRRVLVVGGGIAGTAAALVAARAGASVSVVAAGSGATRFAGGALDFSEWEKGRAHEELSADAGFVLDTLGVFVVRRGAALIATTSGILRPADAIDAALLDLASLSDGEVWVPSADRLGWDAEALAKAWSSSSEAVARRLRFQPVPVSIVRHTEERDLCDADMARLHDEPPRLEWLEERLSSALTAKRPLAMLLPPCLGVEEPRASALSQRLRVRCGEAVSGLAGPSGMRFERARDRAFSARGITPMSARVRALSFDGGWSALLFGAEPLAGFDAVVLATGGLVGGGLDYRPSASTLATELPASAGPILRATVEGPFVIGAHGVPLETPSSLFGAAPEAHAWPFVTEGVLEQGGVLVDDEGRARTAPPGLHAAGDVVADRPRAWLDALSLGARAGAAAVRAA